MRVFTDAGIRVEVHAGSGAVILLADRRGEAVGSWFADAAEAEIDKPVVLFDENGATPLPLGDVVNITRIMPGTH